MSQSFQLKFFHLILYLCWISGSILSQEVNAFTNSGSNERSIGSSYFFYQQPEYPRDCREVRNQCSTNNSSGVYLIKPDGYPEPFEVYCDNTVDSGGWTVIHRLQDSSVPFGRTWKEYKIGFGFLSQEFWIGNDKLSLLTNQKAYELRIDVTSADGLSFHVTYSKFRISDEYGEYKLTSVGEYNGTEDEINRFLCSPNSDDEIYISPHCTQRCYCNNGHFSCDNTYRCSNNAVCEERNNVMQCYCNEGYKGDGVDCTIDIPKDCQDVYDRVSTESRVYQIKPTTWQGDPFEVYCNMTDGGGWTVFQRRVDGSQDFYLYWSHYKNGFGTAEHELWLGNDKLHSVISQGNTQLRVDLVNRYGAPYFAKYSSFSISDESDNYRLSVGGYSGTAGNYLSVFNGQAFTTRDRDNDVHSSINCVTVSCSGCGGPSCTYSGGWWYEHCGGPLTGPYGTGCFRWGSLPGSACNVKYSEMKVRPI